MRDIVVLLSNSKSLSSIHIYISLPIRFQYRSSEILRGEEATIFRFHDTTCITTTARFDGSVYSVSAFLRPFPSICIPVPGIGWKPVVPTKFQESANQTFLDGCSAHSVPSRPLSRGEEGGGVNRVPDREWGGRRGGGGGNARIPSTIEILHSEVRLGAISSSAFKIDSPPRTVIGPHPLPCV